MHGWDWIGMVRLVSSCQLVSMGVRVFKAVSSKDWSKIFCLLVFDCMSGWLCEGILGNFS